MHREQIQQELTVLLKPFTRSMASDFVVTEASSLSRDLNVNSVDLVDLVLEIEERFEVQVPDSALQQFDTVGQFVDFLSAAPVSRRDSQNSAAATG